MTEEIAGFPVADGLYLEALDTATKIINLKIRSEDIPLEDRPAATAKAAAEYIIRNIGRENIE